MRVLITAGPTHEPIDPVRFIGNYSTGKMGYALAAECANRGMEVELISGKVALETPQGSVVRTDVESAEDMYNAVMARVEQCDVAIFCAAVADFTPVERATQKIKRKGDELIIHLKPTKDISAAAGKLKRQGQVFCSFALETNDEEQNALEKMRRKGSDMIVLNSLNDAGAGFGYDTNKVTILLAGGEKFSLPLQSKAEVARHIVDKILELAV